MIRLKIKQILQEKNKTAYWLSKQTGISANNIGKICKVLNCTPNELMETDDPQLNRLITYATYLTRTKDDEK